MTTPSIHRHPSQRLLFMSSPTQHAQTISAFTQIRWPPSPTAGLTTAEQGDKSATRDSFHVRGLRHPVPIFGAPLSSNAAPAQQPELLERAEFLISEDRQPPGDAAPWAEVDLPDQWRYTRPDYAGWGWYRVHAKFERPLPPVTLSTSCTGARTVAWISGPPGAGKSTLAASYVGARNCLCAWYQLDADDADVATFFHYLCHAAHRLDGGRPAHSPRLSRGGPRRRHAPTTNGCT